MEHPRALGRSGDRYPLLTPPAGAGAPTAVDCPADPLTTAMTPARLTPAVWHLWHDSPRPACMNMAVDEALLSTGAGGEQPLLRIYAWDAPAVSIGYFQRFDCAPANGFAVVRRPTGGGLVHHSFDVTFSLTMPACAAFCRLDRAETYRWIHQAVSAAMARVGVATILADDAVAVADRERAICFRTPARYDVMTSDGKLAGGAQRRTRHGILHQGSIDRSRCPHLPASALTAALVGGCRETFGCRMQPFAAPRDLLDEASRLAWEKYATRGWNRRR